jgi:hypothetical protein
MPALHKPGEAPFPLPVADHKLFKGQVRLLAFGKPYDWSLRPYNGETPEEELADRAPSLYLPKIAQEYGLGKILLAPSPIRANAEICTESDVMKKRLAVRSTLYHDTVFLDRGAYADGMIVPPRRALVGSYAGCAVLLVWYPPANLLGVSHVAIRSALDEGRLKGEEPRKNESAVLALVEAMKTAGVRNAAHLEAVIAFSIDPRVFTYRWDDEKYGKINRMRTEDLVNLWGPEAIFGYADPVSRTLGRPDLPAIIAAQLRHAGVPGNSISVIGTLDPNNWPDTRQDGGMRGLIVVQHL